MEPDQQLRNLRDFLLVYNRMTEICFQRCTSNFNYRNLTMDEERCVDSCAGKLIRSNHRLMGTYVQLMPRMVQRRMEEMESKAAESAKAAEAAASAPVGSATSTEGLPVAQPPINPPALLPPAGTDVGLDQTPTVAGQSADKLVASTFPPVSGEATVMPEVHGSVLKPAVLGGPLEPDAAATSVSGIKMAAATSFTPSTETASPLLLDKAANGPSYPAVLPESPVAGAQIELANSIPVSAQPLSAPSRPVTLSEDMPVSTVAAPAVSKATESLPGQQKAPEVPPLSSQ
ncbi:mitochondrial import inner membrane translocase subunit Tim10 B [Myripristis murdjan]|uniref:Mitochondrial import inner membrane translocase subunit Tim10 B n=1 Tax=Myripristis murdjan TaxID=586833 RepID=A0A667XGC8_9TELE|nr:mitochondrial import inner membrane translocase subunit Tim10 B [Myripristis murdjan]